ncbi:lysophospholipid acyltransferase family protein [Futiania mangrovi]|uniref:1-acyl-sn-glycerol-3-phosphate acyltransferase n=1 Tax=Futiania mangrovi TaxID=2959716 RepID=A0A9J6PCW8_9PROT|nr:lysophospholipid acyltransferase family protein [Futiania mangrovii]MCP1336417.1 1-acyl-sn-glycerol-3-phosphate acyltransferase [Futiania mangrovii]
MGRLRAITLLSLFAAWTLALMPVQWAALRLPGRAKVRIPHLYHRSLLRLFGLRMRVTGAPVAPGPVLIVANHQSWVDIVTLSALTELSFIAKGEVGTWPFFGTLARLQRTVFVDRTRRNHTGRQRDEIRARLDAGDRLVLFAEGTSNDGNRVLPFRTALFGAVELSGTPAPCVQPVSVAYTRLHGLPMGRTYRPIVAWYGDMDLAPHLWDWLKAGPMDVEIHVHPPVDPAETGDRKRLARRCETDVRRGLRALLSGRAETLPKAADDGLLDSRPRAATVANET